MTTSIAAAARLAREGRQQLAELEMILQAVATAEEGGEKVATAMDAAKILVATEKVYDKITLLLERAEPLLEDLPDMRRHADAAAGATR